ncbi:MAG: ATP-dependent helicase [Rhodobacterales bacterium]|nr:ATP-dependent helicase [Rhodobacterales bacterium]
MMRGLQATWTPQGTLFFWSLVEPLEPALERDLPGMGELTGLSRRQLAIPKNGELSRRGVNGVEVHLRAALPALTHVSNTAMVSDSLCVWVHTAKFGLELAAQKRVIPEVRGVSALWRALLTRRRDLERLEALIGALPPAARCLPTRERGRGVIRLPTADRAVRGFIDAVVDDLHRRGAHPGPARGWPLELAESLRHPGVVFRPLDVRHHAIPMLMSHWSKESDAVQLRVGIILELPQTGMKHFRVRVQVHPTGHPEQAIPAAEAFSGGESVAIEGRNYLHPAHSLIRGLARASRIHPALRACLDGAKPRDLKWGADDTWEFLSEGLPALRDAGFHIQIPSDFEGAGPRRMRARMRMGGPEEGEMSLGDALSFRWEVTLGDRVLNGDEFTALVARKKPIVFWDGDWVLLDPVELNRLPDGLEQGGKLPISEALRAVLVGEYQGIPVVSDKRLSTVIRALSDPPPVPIPAGLKGTLRPYQERGFWWLTALGQMGLGACLADDMGLGKTIQVICMLLHRRQEDPVHRPSLVVCPTSVLGNWQREISRFGPSLRVRRYHGLDRSLGDLGDCDVLLTTYGLMVREREVLAEIDFDVVCLDEAQGIKNSDSQRARSARSLQARYRVAMSGTPIENRLDELWSLLEFLMPGLLGGRAAFRRNVALPVERFGDTKVAEQLRQGVAPFLLRRLKTDSEIVGDLPAKIEQNEYVPLTKEQAVLYKTVMNDALTGLTGASEIERRGRVLAMLTALKQVCNHPVHFQKQPQGALAGRSGKLERFTDLLEDLFELGERALIFTQYREMGLLLQRQIQEVFAYEVPFLHGATPTRKRDEIVDNFQLSPNAAPALIVSLRAGGTGLNLTRATHVIHYDRWWNPAVEDQATDRAYRIGQDRNVQVHKLVCQGTLEERIDNLLEEKRALAESVVGGGERWVTELDDDMLCRLVALGDDAVVED